MPQIFILLKKKNHTQGKLFYYLRSLQENPKTTGKTKTRTGEEILVSDNTAITRSKHSLMSSQIKLTLKVYLPQSFNQIHHVQLPTKRITKHAKRQNISSEETNEASEPDSDMAEILEGSDWGFLNNNGEYAKGSYSGIREGVVENQDFYHHLTVMRLPPNQWQEITRGVRNSTPTVLVC